MAFQMAVSGIRAATSDLDVIGNNIANANTTGFKASRAQFADVYAASNLGTSKDAIGQGVQLSTVAQQFTQGNVATTDNSLDLAINGDGFFVVEDSEGRFYTRAGAFGLDEQGYLVNATGQRLLGFQVSDGAITGGTGPLNILTSNLAPKATDGIAVEVNLDAASEVLSAGFDPEEPNSYNNSTSLTVYDSLGQEHLATTYFRKSDANDWTAYLYLDDAEVGSTALAFSEYGQLTSPGLTSFAGVTVGPGVDDMTLSLDFTGTTQFGADFGVNALEQDGFTTGQLSGVDIDERGVVLARFSNGQTAPQGQVMLANFGNPQGLQPNGDTLWTESTDSGPPLIGAPGTAALGLVQSGALEESNVDLAAQLVNLIIAQRNYQANAQVIQAEDEVTQTIINIR